MNITREVKKQEAIKRLKALGVISNAIGQFKRDGIVMVSEPPMGGLYWLNDEEKEMVRRFEKENDALVYMVVRAFTNFGKMDALLFVSDYDEEWKMDNENIKDGIVMSYVVNHDMPDCSEFGSIAICSVGGGLLRRG